MTREQAKREIDNIDFYLQHHTDDYSERSHDAMMMAIQALSQEPTEKLMTVDEMEREYEKSKALFHKIVECDDAISRQAVLDGLKGCMCEDWVKTLFATMVKQLPSVTQKSGKWSHDGSHWKNRFICSECNYKLFDEPTNYCPNCGAKMFEPQASEEISERNMKMWEEIFKAERSGK